MFIIVFKQHGALNCETEYYGPFADYMDAEEALVDGRVPLLYGQGGREWPEDINSYADSYRSGHRFINELIPSTK